MLAEILKDIYQKNISINKNYKWEDYWNIV